MLLHDDLHTESRGYNYESHEMAYKASVFLRTGGIGLAVGYLARHIVLWAQNSKVKSRWMQLGP